MTARPTPLVDLKEFDTTIYVVHGHGIMNVATCNKKVICSEDARTLERQLAETREGLAEALIMLEIGSYSARRIAEWRTLTEPK